MEKLKEIEEKLQKIKNKNKEKIEYEKYNKGKSYNMAVNVSLELITGIGIGVVIGLVFIWLSAFKNEIENIKDKVIKIIFFMFISFFSY